MSDENIVEVGEDEEVIVTVLFIAKKDDSRSVRAAVQSDTIAPLGVLSMLKDFMRKFQAQLSKGTEGSWS